MKNGNRLFDIRELNDLTQSEVAKTLNVARQNYSFWETNAKFIPLIHLNNFCKIHNVSMDYVMKLSNVKESKYNLNEIDKKIVGNNIKKFRKEHNIKQEELAKELNTSQSTISAYESGKTLILTSFAYFICEKYDISLDWLCYNTL